MNMRHYGTKVLFTMLICLVNASVSAHDIAVANAEGKIIYYNFVTINWNTTLEVTYRGKYLSTDGNEYSGNVIIPESVDYEGSTFKVTSIGKNAFAYRSSLTSITIPKSVTSIGSGAFYNCNNLYSAICHCSIGESCFRGITSLKEVVLGEEVTEIGDNAFEGCSGLTSVTIPNSVTSIGDEAFHGCSGLTSITIPNSVTSIGDYAFAIENLGSVIIGSGVKSIGSWVFGPPNSNTKKVIWLPNTPPEGYSSGSGIINYVSNSNYTSLKKKIIYPFLSSYFEIDGIRYVPISPSEKTCDAIDCVYDESTKSTRLTSTISYRGVTMSVKNYQPYLAYNNKFIESLSVDIDGMLSEYAFTGCSNLSTVTLGEKVNAIGNNAFQGCEKLQTILIPGSVKELNSYTFSDCKALASITIPQSLSTISNYVFSGCTSLKDVIMADSETELKLGSNGKSPLFSDCPLESVYIGRNINYETSSNFGYSPFYRNTSLRDVKITDREKEISANEFYGCTNLQRVILGDGVTKINDYAFSGCQSLKFFAFGSNVISIGKEAFSDCISMTELTSQASTPPTCGSQALDDINKWNCKLFVPKGCVGVYQAANQWKEFFFIEEGEKPKTEIAINEENFPDENFRAYLMSQSYGKDGIITEEEIKNVVRIDVREKNITNLKGIEYFTALTDLNCSWNQLTSLDGAKNTALTKLDCSSNQLTNLDVSKNTALTVLGCERNQLTSLDVSKNTDLTGLWCRYNQLTSLDVSKNTALTGLYCSSNQLTNLDVSKNTTLTSLVCCNNKIKGEAMDALVGSLPNCESAVIYIIDLSNSSEENVCTSIQVNIAKEKGWRVVTSSGEDYEGSDQILDEDISGFCGDDVNYTYKKANHILTISGSGAIFDYGYDSNKAPWSSYADKIQKIEIESGITSIGYFAFYKCSGITSLSIPATVGYIGSSAFEDCTSLTSLVLNEGLLSIGGSAFESCIGLKTLTIPSTVKSISINAFKNCKGITDVYCYAEAVPDTHFDAFDATPTEKSTLHVPANSVEAYRASWPWSDFKAIVPLGSSGDANGDGVVDDKDINAIVEFIMNGKSDGFNFNNADTNNDQKVNAADIVKIVNMIKK